MVIPQQRVAYLLLVILLVLVLLFVLLVLLSNQLMESSVRNHVCCAMYRFDGTAHTLSELHRHSLLLFPAVACNAGPTCRLQWPRRSRYPLLSSPRATVTAPRVMTKLLKRWPLLVLLPLCHLHYPPANTLLVFIMALAPLSVKSSLPQEPYRHLHMRSSAPHPRHPLALSRAPPLHLLLHPWH